MLQKGLKHMQKDQKKQVIQEIAMIIFYLDEDRFLKQY